MFSVKRNGVHFSSALAFNPFSALAYVCFNTSIGWKQIPEVEADAVWNCSGWSLFPVLCPAFAPSPWPRAGMLNCPSSPQTDPCVERASVAGQLGQQPGWLNSGGDADRRTNFKSMAGLRIWPLLLRLRISKVLFFLIKAKIKSSGDVHRLISSLRNKHLEMMQVQGL